MLCEALQRYMDITLLGATCVLVAGMLSRGGGLYKHYGMLISF